MTKLKYAIILCALFLNATSYGASSREDREESLAKAKKEIAAMEDSFIGRFRTGEVVFTGDLTPIHLCALRNIYGLFVSGSVHNKPLKSIVFANTGLKNAQLDDDFVKWAITTFREVDLSRNLFDDDALPKLVFLVDKCCHSRLDLSGNRLSIAAQGFLQRENEKRPYPITLIL